MGDCLSNLPSVFTFHFNPDPLVRLGEGLKNPLRLFFLGFGLVFVCIILVRGVIQVIQVQVL
jgi:hypothetical protein